MTNDDRLVAGMLQDIHSRDHNRNVLTMRRGDDPTPEPYLQRLALRPQRPLELALAAVNSPRVVRRRTRCDAQTISLSSADSHPR